MAIIGTGRLGSVLGRALRERGYAIDVVVSEHESSARSAAKRMGPGTKWLTAAQLRKPTDAARELFSDVELFLIATPDDVIRDVARDTASLLRFPGRSGGGQRKRGVALHLSGVLPASILAPLGAAGCALGSLHPLVSVSDSRSGPEVFGKAYFCIEGEPAALTTARSIVRDLGGRSFTIASHAKPLYHAAAVMASGHAVALFATAEDLLMRCGVASHEAQQALLPLLRTTVENLQNGFFGRALTGPFARGDITTIRKHIDALRSLKTPLPLDIYLTLAERSLSIAKLGRIDRKISERIAQVLKEAAANRRP